MYSGIEHHIRRAADEFRAAETAPSPNLADAHRCLAAGYARLIQAGGSELAARRLARRDMAFGRC